LHVAAICSDYREAEAERCEQRLSPMAQYRATWRLENLLMVHCRIAALPKRHPDALHDEIMNFAALFEGGFTQRFINRLGQVDARMHDIRPWPSFLRRLSTRRGVAALGQSLRSHGLPSPSRGILAITEP
jgi:hypothetical protein